MYNAEYRRSLVTEQNYADHSLQVIVTRNVYP